MLNVFTFELKRLLGRLTTYIYLALVLISECFFTINVNLYGGSPAFEYTSELITLPLLVLIPILTVCSTAGDNSNGFSAVMRSLSITPVKLISGKTLAILCVFSISLIPAALTPLLLSSIAEVNLLSAYIGILGCFLFGLALISVGVLISSASKKILHSVLFTYGTVAVIYLCEFINTMFYFNINATFFSVIAAAFLLSVAVMRVAHTEWLWIAVLGVLEALTLICRFVFPDALNQFGTALLEFIGIRGALSGFCYGILDISSLMNLILVTVLSAFLGILIISSENGKKTSEVN